jgi:hypothetical protein
METTKLMEQTSEAAQYYWSHQLVASFTLGIVCFLAGLLLGAVLWAGRKKKALRFEVRNQELRRKIAALETGEETISAPEPTEGQA